MDIVIEKSIDVNMPLRTVYNQWTQFEDFPLFMRGVESIEQITDTLLRWKASVAGVKREFDAEIVEQIPDRAIAWRSRDGEILAGRVTFEKLDPRWTRVRVRIAHSPEGLADELGDILG